MQSDFEEERRRTQPPRDSGTRVRCPVLVHSLATLDLRPGFSGPAVNSASLWPADEAPETRSYRTNMNKEADFTLNSPPPFLPLVGFWLSVAWLVGCGDGLL
ncbi:HTH-type transcriptional regulator RpiR [Labeo rohita]|uniref:HTH-type transcriptional regulator RpiR n=1 Tax=Labeo rohita TaxID=84645 RepID=A0ABQ8LRX4_LABRO|nr:HTH-type transcriptional regulator RpiR [Labeo rohita]